MNGNIAKKIENANKTEQESNSKVSELIANTKVSTDLKSEKLTYILQMLEVLRKLSDTLDEKMVAYLIEMAVLETNTAINVLEFGTEIGGRSKKGREGL